MAIAYDSVTNPDLNTGGDLDLTHSCSGSDRILWAGVLMRNTTVNSITYNGTAMTQVGSRIGPIGGSNDYVALYFLTNPATGSNTFNVTLNAANLVIGALVSYNGADSAGQPDGATDNGFTVETTTNTSVTTTADNCWVIGVGRGNADGLLYAGTATTMRATLDPTGGYIQMFDNGGPKTPAGSVTLQTTQANQPTGHKIASFKPATGGGGTIRLQTNLTLLGVG